MTREESLLARWSRRKREQEDAQKRPVQASTDDHTKADSGKPASTCDGPSLPDEAPLRLPPIESLTPESDFTVFMRADVPDELRHQALQKLWRSDPVFANQDGLLEYGQDYSQQFKTGAVISTLYKVGQGLFRPEPNQGTGDATALEVAQIPDQPEEPSGAPDTNEPGEETI